jgi:tetrahydromethanopterin S-methyltransferase subunit B
MSEKPEQERLAVLETKVDSLIKSMENVTTKLDLILPTFVTQVQLTEKTSGLNNEISGLKVELVNVRKRSTLLNWLTGVLGTVFGAVMMFLIQGYFSK